MRISVRDVGLAKIVEVDRPPVRRKSDIYDSRIHRLDTRST
jgi:hypothetical protein